MEESTDFQIVTTMTEETPEVEGEGQGYKFYYFYQEDGEEGGEGKLIPVVFEEGCVDTDTVSCLNGIEWNGGEIATTGNGAVASTEVEWTVGTTGGNISTVEVTEEDDVESMKSVSVDSKSSMMTGTGYNASGEEASDASASEIEDVTNFDDEKAKVELEFPHGTIVWATDPVVSEADFLGVVLEPGLSFDASSYRMSVITLSADLLECKCYQKGMKVVFDLSDGTWIFCHPKNLRPVYTQPAVVAMDDANLQVETPKENELLVVQP